MKNSKPQQSERLSLFKRTRASGENLLTNNPQEVAIWSILIVFIICFVVTLILFCINIGNLKNLNDLTKTGPLGDSYNGILGPFIAFLVAILTFLAFWAQFNSNNEQRKQFERQNKDQLFFRLMDAQQSKIINSSFTTENNTEVSSFQLLEHIVNKFYHQIVIECRSLAREVVRTKFETLSNNFYFKMFDAIGIPIDEFDKEKREFIEIMKELDHNDRWEYIKTYFGSLHGETPKQLDALEAIGTVHFYKVPFLERQNIYDVSYQIIEREYGSFLDGYFKGFEFISQTITTLDNQQIYNQYLLSQLSKYEKILIFYYIASGKNSESFALFVRSNKILEGIHSYNALLVDLPSKDEMDKELNFIFDFRNS